jgi:hypothetical protein
MQRMYVILIFASVWCISFVIRWHSSQATPAIVERISTEIFIHAEWTSTTSSCKHLARWRVKTEVWWERSFHVPRRFPQFPWTSRYQHRWITAFKHFPSVIFSFASIIIVIISKSINDSIHRPQKIDRRRWRNTEN